MLHNFVYNSKYIIKFVTGAERGFIITFLLKNIRVLLFNSTLFYFPK